MKNSKGDIVQELANTCKEYGPRSGVYLSPWDRNHTGYCRLEYITFFRNQFLELLTKFGDVFEIWFDWANGGSGYYVGGRVTRKIDQTTLISYQFFVSSDNKQQNLVDEGEFPNNRNNRVWQAKKFTLANACYFLLRKITGVVKHRGYQWSRLRRSRRTD